MKATANTSDSHWNNQTSKASYAKSKRKAGNYQKSKDNPTHAKD